MKNYADKSGVDSWQMTDDGKFNIQNTSCIIISPYHASHISYIITSYIYNLLIHVPMLFYHGFIPFHINCFFAFGYH